MKNETQYPEFENALALNFSKPLSPAEQNFVQQIIGYGCVTHLAMPKGESPTFEWLNGTQTIVTYVDTSKSNSRDISFRIPTFWDNLEKGLVEGTEPRKTRKAGPVGSRLVEPVGMTAEIHSVVTDVVYSDSGHCDRYTADDVREIACAVFNAYFGEPEPIVPEPVVLVDEDVPETLNIEVPKGAKRITITIDF